MPTPSAMAFQLKDTIEFLGAYVDIKALKKAMKERGGNTANFIWKVFQEVLKDVAQTFQNRAICEQTFYSHNKNIYGMMYQFLMHYEGKNPLHVQALYYFNDIKLTQIQHPDLLGFKVLCYGCCDLCNAANNKVMSVDKALEHALGTTNRCKVQYNQACRVTYVSISP